MSRSTMGIEHVASLDGDAGTKERLEAVLETLSGRTTIEASCERLSISPARFHELRKAALAGALGALSPKPPGRPRSAPTDSPEVERLRTEIATLRCDLEASRIREEIAIVMPHLIRPRAAAEKKGSRRNRDEPLAT